MKRKFLHGGIGIRGQCARIACCLILLLLIGFDCRSSDSPEDHGGVTHFILQVESSNDVFEDKIDSIRMRRSIHERMEKLGIHNATVRGEKDNRISIQVPACRDPERVISIIGRSFVLEFRLVRDEVDVEDGLKDNTPPGTEILYMKSLDPETGQAAMKPILVDVEPLMTGKRIVSAETKISTYNEPYIAIAFDSTGADMFEKITSRNIGKRLAIVLDRVVQSTPVIRDTISGGKAIIDGRFTFKEAADLVKILTAGSYPKNITAVEIIQLDRIDCSRGDR